MYSKYYWKRPRLYLWVAASWFAICILFCIVTPFIIINVISSSVDLIQSLSHTKQHIDDLFFSQCIISSQSALIFQTSAQDAEPELIPRDKMIDFVDLNLRKSFGYYLFILWDVKHQCHYNLDLEIR